jgi:hypothetical protein
MNHLKRNPFTDYFYVFMIGFLLCLFVQFYLQDKFESNFFQNVSQGIAAKRPLFNEDSSIVDALHVTYRLLSDRTVVLKETSQSNYDMYSGSLTNDLLTAKDACGSYAAVLTNLLRTMGFDTRIVQMKVNNIYGGHIITEVSTKKGWVVLDAMYDLFFKTPAGTMASFADVSGNWAYYKVQTPKEYNKDYKYEDLRYANWNKIPIIMPIMKSILSLTLGAKKTNAISIRPLFLRKYKFYCLLLIPLILFFSVRFLSNKIHIRSSWRQAPLTQLSYSRSRQVYYKKTPVDITVFNIPFNSKIGALRHRLRLARKRPFPSSSRLERESLIS